LFFASNSRDPLLYFWVFFLQCKKNKQFPIECFKVVCYSGMANAPKTKAMGHLGSCWEMLNSYRIACRHLLNDIGKPLGNNQIKLLPAGHMLLLAGCDENPGNKAISQEETSLIVQRLLAKMWQFLFIFSEPLHFC
jgi:hypothetical protein